MHLPPRWEVLSDCIAEMFQNCLELSPGVLFVVHSTQPRSRYRCITSLSISVDIATHTRAPQTALEIDPTPELAPFVPIHNLHDLSHNIVQRAKFCLFVPSGSSVEDDVPPEDV